MLIGSMAVTANPDMASRSIARPALFGRVVFADASLESNLRRRSLLTALTKANAWQEQLESGQFEDLEDIAKEQGVDRSYVGRMLQLTSLSPDIVESILAGQAFADISLQHCRKGIPVFWEEQRRVLKSTAAHDLEAVANQ